MRTVAHDGNGHLRLLDLIDAEMDVQLVGAAVKSLSQEFQTFEKLLLRAVRLVHVGGEVIAVQAGCRTRVHRQLGKEPRQAFQYLIALLLAENSSKRCSARPSCRSQARHARRRRSLRGHKDP